MAYARKDYLGSKATTTLNGSINNSTTSITITSATGWPSVSNTGFYAVIDPDSADEEKVFVTARSGTGLTATRGVDGSTAVSHASGATIRPCFTAVDFDEANYMVTETVGNITAAGDLLVASGANNLTRLAKGSNSTILAVDSGGTLGYTTVTNAMVDASAAIALSKLATIANNTVLGNTSGSTAAPTAISNFSSLFGGAWSTLTMVSDVSATSDTTLNAESQLNTSGLLTSNTYYQIIAAFIYASPSGGATPGFKFGWDGAGQATAFDVYYIGTSGNATVSQLRGPSSNSITAQTSASKRLVLAVGALEPYSGGNSFVPYWSQGTSSANATILYTGSTVWYRAVT